MQKLEIDSISYLYPKAVEGGTLEARHPSVHASNIIKLNDSYIIAWFGGTREKHIDTGIWGSIITDSFSQPFRIAKVGMIPHWNPILFWWNNQLICFFRVGVDCSNWRTWITRSTDGQSWSRPSVMMDGDLLGRGPSKCKPIILSNGTIIAPGSQELDHWSSHFDLFSDKWKLTEPLFATTDPPPIRGHANGIIQPAVWESKNGHVHALMRSTHNYLYRADSMDFGKTWCNPYITKIPNNNSGIDVVRHNNLLALVYNPVAQNWGCRSPLSVALSDDNGITWCNSVNVENHDREFSYPSMISDGDRLLISYTDSRRRIGVASISTHSTQSKILIH